jgi:anti-anti-sigma factor
MSIVQDDRVRQMPVRSGLHTHRPVGDGRGLRHPTVPTKHPNSFREAGMRVDVFHYLPTEVCLEERPSPPARTTVAAIFGDVDELTVAQFTEGLRHAIDTAVGTLVIDLTHVGFLGVAGAQSLAAVEAHADTEGVNLLLVGGRAVARCLEVTGLLARFRCFPSMQSAMTTGPTE